MDPLKDMLSEEFARLATEPVKAQVRRVVFDPDIPPADRALLRLRADRLVPAHLGPAPVRRVMSLPPPHRLDRMMARGIMTVALVLSVATVGQVAAGAEPSAGTLIRNGIVALVGTSAAWRWCSPSGVWW